MNTFKLLFLVLFALSIKALGQGPKTLKDSLLIYYSLDELKNMSIDEYRNAKRKIRGLNPLDLEFQSPATDQWGIPRVEVNENEEEALKRIKGRVQIIDQEKNDYKQIIYPNSYADVLNKYFEGIYDDIVKRTLKHDDYKTYFDSTSWRDVNDFSNHTKRVYYLDSEEKIKLITIEYGDNINEGPRDDYYDMFPLSYQKISYYIWADSLQSVHSIVGHQRIANKLPDEIPTSEDLSSSPIASSSYHRYYYKNNCFRQLTKEGLFSKSSWKENLANQINIEDKNCSNKEVVIARNYIMEFRERNQNSYLKPVMSSYIQPYILTPEN